MTGEGVGQTRIVSVTVIKGVTMPRNAATIGAGIGVSGIGMMIGIGRIGTKIGVSGIGMMIGVGDMMTAETGTGTTTGVPCLPWSMSPILMSFACLAMPLALPSPTSCGSLQPGALYPRPTTVVIPFIHPPSDSSSGVIGATALTVTDTATQAPVGVAMTGTGTPAMVSSLFPPLPPGH